MKDAPVEAVKIAVKGASVIVVVSEEQESEGTARLTLRGAVDRAGHARDRHGHRLPRGARPTGDLDRRSSCSRWSIAAVAGGLWGGLIAGILASTLRPLVVEDPQLTFRFDDVEDVADGRRLPVGGAGRGPAGRASEPRSGPAPHAASARRGSWARCRARCIPREVPDRVLDEFAEVLLEPFGLSRVEIDATLDGTESVPSRRADGEATAGGPRTIVPLLAGEACRSARSSRSDRPEAGPSPRDEQLLLEAAARQAAAALDRARLDARARTPSSTPRPTSSARRCSPRSPMTCGRRSRRSRRA